MVIVFVLPLFGSELLTVCQFAIYFVLGSAYASLWLVALGFFVSPFVKFMKSLGTRRYYITGSWNSQGLTRMLPEKGTDGLVHKPSAQSFGSHSLSPRVFSCGLLLRQKSFPSRDP